MTLSVEDRLEALKNRLHQRAEEAADKKITLPSTPSLETLLKRLQLSDHEADMRQMDDAH